MPKRLPMTRSLCLLACVASSAGCLATITVDGFEVGRADYEEQVSAVRAQAAVDFSCPAADIKATVLQVSPSGDAVTVQQFDVSGCGRRAIYVRTLSGWVLNGVPEEPPGAAP